MYNYVYSKRSGKTGYAGNGVAKLHYFAEVDRNLASESHGAPTRKGARASFVRLGR